MSRLRVIVCDDHYLLAQGLQRLLEPEFDVIAVLRDGEQLVESILAQQPDACVVDISMPGLSGIEVARKIRSAGLTCKFVALTMHSEIAYVREAFAAGINGYVLKESAASELQFALREVLLDRSYITPAVASDVLRCVVGEEKVVRQEEVRLTPRQRQVLELIAKGYSNKEIASALQISVKTVDFHRPAIVSKLGVRSTAELTRYALKHGIISSLILAFLFAF